MAQLFPERKEKKKSLLLKINTNLAKPSGRSPDRPSARILEPRFACCKCGSSRNIHAKPSPRSRKRSIIYLFLEHAGSDAVRFMGKPIVFPQPPTRILASFQRKKKNKQQERQGKGGACFDFPLFVPSTSRDSARLASPLRHAERRCASSSLLPFRSHCDFWRYNPGDVSENGEQQGLSLPGRSMGDQDHTSCFSRETDSREILI